MGDDPEREYRNELDQRRMEQRNAEDNARQYRESEERRMRSMGPGPGLGPSNGAPSANAMWWASRRLFGKALLITVPLGAVLLVWPRDSASVSIPEILRLFGGAFVASLGSPKLRPAAFGCLIVAAVIGVALYFIGAALAHSAH